MHKIPTDAFDMLVTLEKRPFERAGREVVVRLLDETLPDGTKLVAASDPSYPPELAALEEHPAVLVHEGDLSLTERQLRVSIVGSRDASDSARAVARRVARELAARGAVVVSGLAAGIDTAAHEGALEARSPSGTVGRTIAVMGTPLSQPWPPANARLARRIAEYGLLISLAPQVNGLSFTDEERAVYKRGRNAKVNSVPQHADVAQYHAATGLETLFGWLYLLGRTQRLRELVRLLLEHLKGHGALFARADHAVQDLALVKALAAAVLFDDDHRQALHRLIGGEALGTREALAPAADAAALFGRAGINDLALFVSAIGTFHRAEPLFSS